jgi:hypothetical protein
MTLMNLQELSTRTNIPIRRLRHCLDEGLIPGLDLESGAYEIGRRRRFHETVGFALCCAATLVEGGIDRSTVRVFLGGIAKLKHPKTNDLLLTTILNRHAQAVAELGDNCNIRVRVPKPLAYDSGWIQPDTGAQLHASYQPRFTIGLNLGQVGAAVFGW